AARARWYSSIIRTRRPRLLCSSEERIEVRSRVTNHAASLRKIALSLVSIVTEPAPKKTPLYDEHMRLGAKMVPFAGWLMPVQYTSIVEEHQAVRNHVGVFDISHMGQFIVEGAGGVHWLNSMLTNNIAKPNVGIVQ